MVASPTPDAPGAGPPTAPRAAEQCKQPLGCPPTPTLPPTPPFGSGSGGGDVSCNGSAGTTVRAFLGLCAASIVAAGVGLPCMSLLPPLGPLDEVGRMRYLSDGFEAHTIEATVLIVATAPFLFGLRATSIADHATSRPAALLGMACLVCGLVASALTVRNDTLKDGHMAAALAWILSSIVSQAVAVWGLNRSRHAAAAPPPRDARVAAAFCAMSLAAGVAYAAIMASGAQRWGGNAWRAGGGVAQLLCLWCVLGVDSCLLLLASRDVEAALLWYD